MYVTYYIHTMIKKYQVLAEENIASIRDIQKNPSKALQGITRVMRGGKTFGFFFSNEELDELLEDMEAFSSSKFKTHISKARRELKEGKTVSLSSVANQYGL